MSLRTIALDPNKAWTSIWEVIQERDCDPNPNKWSLRNPNGSLHHKHRAYDYKHQLIRNAKEDFNIITIGNHILNRK